MNTHILGGVEYPCVEAYVAHPVEPNVLARLWKCLLGRHESDDRLCWGSSYWFGMVCRSANR